MFLVHGFLSRKNGTYLSYVDGISRDDFARLDWNDILDAADTGYAEICENPGVCFFVARPSDKTYEDTMKFPTLEAAVAAALTLHGGTK